MVDSRDSSMRLKKMLQGISVLTSINEDQIFNPQGGEIYGRIVLFKLSLQSMTACSVDSTYYDRVMATLGSQRSNSILLFLRLIRRWRVTDTPDDLRLIKTEKTFFTG
jgi:hypothetical protein